MSTFDDRCVDLQRSMIDVLTFEDQCVDLQRSIVNVSIFGDQSTHRSSKGSTIDLHRSTHRSSKIEGAWKHLTDNPTSHQQFVTEYCSQWCHRLE